MSTALVTGGAGFIGSHLVDRLLEEGWRVIILDNFSTGRFENVEQAFKTGRLRIMIGDAKTIDLLDEESSVEHVFHFAANPDVRETSPSIHFQENIVATFNMLEYARRAGVKMFVFASSSTVYGDASKIPTPEDYGPLKPISLYGAAKLAAEGLVSSYCHTFGMKGVSLRLANVVGPRLTHGVVHDFINKLLNNPGRLEILGDGSQSKSYIWVGDCIEAVLHVLKHAEVSRYEVYNIGSEDWVTVSEIADMVVESMGLRSVQKVFTGGVENGRGWIGDVKLMSLDISRIKAAGWRPRHTSREAVKLCIEARLRELGLKP
ncbi:MAG: NAD-dependent epimerase/dehydratase family protein [Candidatus Brockarchaeota archaeon]|nr:NAD-dependent epimerase/dehydratase family protein [Candidatus Brockarchaeota archaeon]MBO3809054.1 NAD-dependent epimerase/dehydratase family protein [Candidatus Brockarchaeota archaeon]